MPPEEMTTSGTVDEDAPLDPATLRVQRKLTRLLAVSGGIMLIGFLTVAATIVYRLSETGAGDAVPAATIDIGRDVRSATVSGDRLVLTFGGSNPRIEIRDLSAGALILTVRLGQDGTADAAPPSP